MVSKILEVLDVLKQNFNKFVSGEKISKIVGISRVGVYKIINKLISEGFEIKKQKKLGYKLVSYPFLPEEILRQNFNIIKKVYFYKKISSTMDLAKEIISQQKEYDKSLILALEQTEGKGRLQRKWFSPKGGLYFSLIIKPNIPPFEVFMLNFVFSLSVVETLKEYGVNANTKWPNDVLVDNKKICGILIETDTEIDKVNYCIVGVGVNVNIDNQFFKKHKLEATSIYALTNKKVDFTQFFIFLLKKVEYWYEIFEKKEYDKIVNEWKKYSSTIGKIVEIQTLEGKIIGKAIDVSSKGTLIIKTSSKQEIEILSGDCIHLR